MRPSQDVYFMGMARLVSTRSTCARRAVGAVAVNTRGHLLATGYNGNPAGLPHCNEGHPCVGPKPVDHCQAVHAEINMLAQCRDVWAIDRVYVTVSPCPACMGALISSGCRALFVGGDYPGGGEALALWRAVGREFYRL
jgi:dCMP deaminase